MLLRLVLGTLLIQAAFAENVAARAQTSQSLQPALQRRVHDYKLTADSFLQALAKAAGDFQIPMGIEWVWSRDTIGKVDMAWHDATVYQVIRSVADTQPGYQVDLSGGVVHVFPQSLAADRANFLNLKVSAFEARGELFAFVTMRLQALVRQTVSPPPPPPPGSGEGSNVGSTPGEKPLRLKLRDVTVEKALNVICSLSDQRIWVVTFCEDCGLTPAGFRRTVALWRSGPLPDDLQPAWDTFRWGQEIPLEPLKPN